MELRCSSLTAQLARMEGETGRAGRAEDELMEKVAVLSRELSQSVGASEHVSGELEGLRRRIQELDGEKRMLEDRLENNKMLVMESRKEGQEMEKQLAELRHKLGEAGEQKVTMFALPLLRSFSLKLPRRPKLKPK